MARGHLLKDAWVALYDCIGIPQEHLPGIEDLVQCNVFAYHPSVVVVNPTGEDLVSKRFVNLSRELQETFEQCLEHMSRGKRISSHMKLKLPLMVLEYVAHLTAWRAKYIERKGHYAKKALLDIFYALMSGDGDDEAKVKVAQKKIKELEAVLKGFCGSKEAHEFFTQQYQRIGKCLVMHLESAKMDPAHALRVHHVLLLVDGEEPLFPVIDMPYVAAVWAQLKVLGASPIPFPVEQEALRAVLGGIAGPSVLALYDTWLIEIE